MMTNGTKRVQLLLVVCLGKSLLSLFILSKSLRYKSGLPTRHSRFGAVPSEFALDDVVCTGTENNLYDCHHKLHDNCDASEGAGVICQGTFTI